MTDPTDLFKKLVRERKDTQPASSKSTPPDTPETKRRGRPATGKRSDPNWIGRTYYIRKETDLDIEDELLQLKRQGIEIDKSELVEELLNAWVKWRQGEDSEILLSEISPRRKDDKRERC
jgi:hypothetical protein